VLIGIAVAFIGDGLRDALDPNASGAKAKAKKLKPEGTEKAGKGLPGQAQGPSTSTDALSTS
jgi:peptide/nickel transport system permease protein